MALDPILHFDARPRTMAEVEAERKAKESPKVIGYLTLFMKNGALTEPGAPVATRADALLAASEEWPGCDYFGTIEIMSDRSTKLLNLFDEAQVFQKAARREWLASLRDLPAYHAKVL